MIRHGHYLGYVNDGCRCSECRRAHAAYKEGWVLRHRRGQMWADPGPAADNLRSLTEWGVSLTAVARVLDGVGIGTLRKVLAGEKVRPHVVDPIATVTLADLPPTSYVPPERARQLVDRARELGATWNDVAEGLGWGSLPGGWPGPRGVMLKHVLALRQLVDRLEAVCDDCGAPSWEGGTWCWPCYQRRSLPQTRSEIEAASRRERDRLKRARHRRGVAA